MLEALYPDEAETYSKARKAFEDGYVSHYEWAMEHLEKNELTPADTKEVIDTLDMYRALFYFKRDNPTTDVDQYDLIFKGYDGNSRDEYRLLGYARYFIVDLNRFQEILEQQGEHFDFNSHCEMRVRYQAMLAIWHSFPAGTNSGERHCLKEDQVKRIIEAR
jgi:uncharacterized protein YfbU (UPF0304 family)